MLFNVLKRLIEKGAEKTLPKKIDVFYAAGKLTKKEYEELIALLNKGA
jgi:hypothetical protein